MHDAFTLLQGAVIGALYCYTNHLSTRVKALEQWGVELTKVIDNDRSIQMSNIDRFNKIIEELRSEKAE